MSQHDRVPLAPLGPGRRTGWLEIRPVPRILPHLGEISSVPAGRLDGRDLAEDDLGEEIRVVAAAQVNHVLDSSLTVEG